jgi:hypothetical protein
LDHTCHKCTKVKPQEEFVQSRKNKKGEPRYDICKNCYANRVRIKYLEDFFLLSLEDSEKIFAYQDNRCAICGNPPKPPHFRRLALDHRHSDGLLRGALCNQCNRAIARFNDDPVRLAAAAEYLKHPPAVKALRREHFARPGRMGTKKQRKAIQQEKAAAALKHTIVIMEAQAFTESVLGSAQLVKKKRRKSAIKTVGA